MNIHIFSHKTNKWLKPVKNIKRVSNIKESDTFKLLKSSGKVLTYDKKYYDLDFIFES